MASFRFSFISNEMFRHFTHSILAISALLIGEVSQARDITIPYTGRFVEANAKPIEGPVDIVLEFFSKEAGGESLASPQSFPAVALEDGVFQLNIALSSAEFHKLIPSVDSPLWIQVTDATNGAVYPRQAMATSAFALKVPVDGTTISWNSEGQLELNKNVAINKVGGQTFVTSGASAGQVLAWDVGSKTWKPSSVSASANSIANDGISGDKIDSGTISHFASTGIDDNATGNAVTINSIGKVGIGTTSPFANLDIRSNDAVTTSQVIGNTSTGTAQIVLDASDGDAVGSDYFVIRQNDDLSAILYTGGAGGPIHFAAKSLIPQLTLDGTGNVGIGTTSPTSLLNLVRTNPTAGDGLVLDFFSNSANVRPSIITRKARGTASAPLILQDGDVIGGFNVQAYDGSIFRSAATIRGEVTGVVTPGQSPPTSLKFFTSDASGVETQRVAISPAGGVGIGTTTPLRTLEVNFTDDTIYADGVVPSGLRIRNASTVSGANASLFFDQAVIGGATAGINGRSVGPDQMDLDFFTENAVRSTKMTIKANGNVGVGTTNPTANLDIHTNSGPSILQVSSPGLAATDQANLRLVTQSDGQGLGFAGNQGWEIFSRGNTFATAEQQNDLGFYFWDGSAWRYTLGMDSLTQNVGIGDPSPDAKLEVSVSGGSEDYLMLSSVDANDGDVMVVKNSGKVGIGTSSPQTTLDVNGTARLAKFTNEPYVCDLNHDGAIALTTANYLCVCINGTGWKRASDGSTACSTW